MLDTASKLEVQFLHQRDIHIGRDQRDEDFGKGRIDIARAVSVGRRAGACDIAAVEIAGHAVGEGDRAVEARVAIVVESLAAELDARRDADIAARQGEEVVAAKLEVCQRQAGAALAEHVDAERIDGRGRVGRTIALARIVQATAVERVIGVGRRQVYLLLHQRERYAVAGKVDQVGLGIQNAGVEIPCAKRPAQARNKAVGILVDRHVAVADIDETIAFHDEIGPACGNGRPRQSIGIGRTVCQRRRAEGVPVGIARNADRHRAQDGRSLDIAAVLGAVIAALEIGFDIVRQLVAEQGHRVVTLLCADQIVAEIGVVADCAGRRGAVAGADAIAEIEAAARKGRRLQVEVVIADRCAAGRCLDVELAERAECVAVIERCIAFEVRALDQREAVVFARVIAL